MTNPNVLKLYHSKIVFSPTDKVLICNDFLIDSIQLISIFNAILKNASNTQLLSFSFFLKGERFLF